MHSSELLGLLDIFAKGASTSMGGLVTVSSNIIHASEARWTIFEVSMASFGDRHESNELVAVHTR